MRHLALVKFQGDGNDEIAARRGGIENRVAIREMEICMSESLEFASGGVVNSDVSKSVGDFLAVGTDVLDWRGAGAAGDFGEGFDAGETSGAGIFDDGIPLGAAHGGDFGGGVGDAGDGVADDDAGVALVVSDGIGAAAEDEDGKMMLLGKSEGGGDVVLGLDVDQKAGGAAEPHSGEGR